MAQPAEDIVQRYRAHLRAKGLRPVQIWVPDTRRPGFKGECRRQSALCVKADKASEELDAWMDQAVRDIEGWT